jgi:hypothetical protein
MSTRQTANSPYPSKYAPGKFVTPAQYINELVCEQAAKREGRELPLYFWKHEEWQKYWGGQVRIINNLLKKYSPKVIIKVVQDHRVDNLRTQYYRRFLKTAQEIENSRVKERQVLVIKEDQDVILPEKKNKKNIINKLMDLDRL